MNKVFLEVQIFIHDLKMRGIVLYWKHPQMFRRKTTRQYLHFHYVSRFACTNGFFKLTRMHSSRMRTARSLTVSRRIPCTPPATMHTPGTVHAPWHHSYPPAPCTPPTRHVPPCGQTDTCKNITFANFVCGR